MTTKVARQRWMAEYFPVCIRRVLVACRATAASPSPGSLLKNGAFCGTDFPVGLLGDRQQRLTDWRVGPTDFFGRLLAS